MTIHHHILTSKARPKKTITIRIHLRRYPTSITAPLSWVRPFSMHSLLICGGGSTLHPPFFFKPKVDVASSHVVSCLASNLATSALVSSTTSRLAKSARTCIKFRSINISMYSSSQYQNLHPFYTIKLKVSTTSLIREHKPKLKRAHTPSFKHLMNTHPGCSGVVDTRRTTILGQWSHLMRGNGVPTSFWASTEPGRPPFVYLPADHRWCKSERLEDEPLPACGLAALPGPSGEVPGEGVLD